MQLHLSKCTSIQRAKGRGERQEARATLGALGTLGTLLVFEGTFNISFRAAMRCFYYLCNVDTVKSHANATDNGSANQVRRTLRQFVAILRFIVEWFQMHVEEVPDFSLWIHG